MKFSFGKKTKSGFLGSFPTFAAAKAHSTSLPVSTFPHHGDACLVTSREQQVLAAFLLSGVARDARVLDFGGGGGYYFHTLRRCGPVSWTVVETPDIVAANKANTQIRFLDHIPLESFDFILASGAIQYDEHPYDVLATLLAMGQPICLNRVPLIAAAADIVTLQHHDDSRVPAWFFASSSR